MVWGIGEYPPEFNAKVHGPYDPSRFYGKPDASFSQVKLGELFKWFGRRNYHPLAVGRAIGRGFWKWNLNWVQVKKPGMAPFVQAVMALSIFYYINQYPHLKYHRHVKYHW